MSRSFAGASTQYLDVAAASVSGSPFSMACWFRVTNITQNHILVWVGVEGDSGKWSAIRAAGQEAGDPASFIQNQYTAGPTGEAQSSSAYTANTWHHIVGTCASATSRAVFLDGGNKGTDTTNVGTVTGHDKHSIGMARDGSPSGPTDGYIAEVAVWNVVLSDAEAAILALGYWPPYVRPANLLAYWPLLGNLSPEIDRVGRFDMTLVNTPTKAAHPRVIYPGSRFASSIGQQIAAAAEFRRRLIFAT